MVMNTLTKKWLLSLKANFLIKLIVKYIHIISDGGSWGFINLTNPDFEVGDILFSASWAKPALNHARGNIFTG